MTKYHQTPAERRVIKHQTERLRVAIERAEKAEAQRETDAEVIKAAEELAKVLERIRDGSQHPVEAIAMAHCALAAFRKAQETMK